MSMVRLGDLLSVQNGYAFKSDMFCGKDKGIPVIRIGDIHNDDTGANYVGGYRDDFVVYQHDLLVGMSGDFSCSLWNGPASVLNQRVCRLEKFRWDVDKRYIYYWLQPTLKKLQDATAFLVIKNLSSKTIEALQINLPPLPEQQRIVEILDRAAAIQRLRKAAEDKAREIVPALFVDMFGDPATNPKGWPGSELGDLVTLVSGGTPSKNNAAYWQGDVPWVSPKDMKAWNITDAEDHINASVFRETNLKEIASDTVLVVVRGMILAHTVPIAITRRAVAINQDMKGLVCKSGLIPDYLLWAMRVRHSELLHEVSTAAHGTKKLDTARLEQLRIHVPPRELQEHFSRLVHDAVRRGALIKEATQASSGLQASLVAKLLG